MRLLVMDPHRDKVWLYVLFVLFCRFLITFANSLDPDQDRQNVGLDLDPNCLTFLVVFLKDLFDKGNFGKVCRRQSMKNCPECIYNMYILFRTE